MPGSHVDQLLEEYLRVINDKDDQIHRLLREAQEAEAAASQRDAASTATQQRLSEQLHSKSRKLKEAEVQAARDEENVRELSLAADALKTQLQECERRADAHAAAAAEAAERVHRLEGALSAAQEALSTAQAHKATSDEEWAATQQQLHAQTTAAADLKTELAAATKAADAARAQEQQLRARMEEMMPRHAHAAELAALEATLATERAERKQRDDALQEALSKQEVEHRATQQALRKANLDVEELTASLQATAKALEAARHRLDTTGLTAQQVERELRDEAVRCRRAHAEAVERVGELERSLARSQEAVQRASAELQATTVQLERTKAAAERTQDGAQAQLRTLQEQVRQLQDEADRTRRALDARERAAQDGVDGIARAREEAARVQAELRERLATATAAATSRAEECGRLQQQLGRAEAELVDAQRRAVADERGVAHKLEELHAGVQRLQGLLQDREEEGRRAELLHGKEVQKLQHDHAVAVEDLRRRHDSEVRDVQTRLDLARAELGERTGGTKGLEKELHHIAEVRQELQSEMTRMRNAIEAKENTIQALRHEVDKQQAEVSQLTQKLAAQERSAAAGRQRLEEAERAQLDAKAAQERTAEQLAVAKKATESHAAAAASLEAQLSRRDAAIAALRRDVEDGVEAKQAALKEAMLKRAQRDKAALALAAAEERASRAEGEQCAAVQELQRLQRTIEERAEDARRLREATEQREAECARLVRHAAEVEALAKRTADELRQSVHERDETLQRLRAEQATVLPHLNEEKGKSLVLLERLQHQQEVSRMQLDAAEQRARGLEEAAAARETEMEALLADKARTAQQLTEGQARVAALTATLEGREHKFQQRKEEVQKALRQIEETRTASAVAVERAAQETAAAAAVRDKYKKEKAKMESLLQRMEERVRESTRLKKTDHQRASELAEKLAEAEAALRRLQDSAESRIGEVKSRCEDMCRQHEASFRGAASDAAAVEKRAAALQVQLVEAQRRAAAAEGSLRELQRHVAAARAVALEEYAEEVTDMKRTCIDLVLRAHRGTITRAVSAAKDGWSAVQSTAAHCSASVRDTERQLARLQVEHRAELRALEEAHTRRAEVAAAASHEAVQRLQRELVEAERRVAAQREATQRADGDREERGRAAQESVAQLAALLELEKRQNASLRERLAAEEGKRGAEAQAALEERRALQRSHDKLKRQLEDRVVEVQHSEDELRELRAEVAALQRVLAEKERVAKQETERAGKEQERVATAAAASAAAEQRCAELQKQLDFMRGQLETARCSHERVVKEHQATQRNRDTRLDGVQAELTTTLAEGRRFQRDIEALQQRVAELTKEVQALRRQEAGVLGQLQARKAEVSALRERCANLESLKNISEATLAETQLRERDLMDKIEELRNAQQLMQLCFDKQQEQLEVGRRLRQQDAVQRSRFSP